MEDITFHTEDVENPLIQDDIYIKWLRSISFSEGKRIKKLSYIFCSDEYLLNINRTYLNHDYFTDIITFPYTEGDDIESDIYISLDRVKENALSFDTSFENELLRVMVHGLLHLVGYGDKTEEESHIMRKKEEESIEQFYR